MADPEPKLSRPDRRRRRRAREFLDAAQRIVSAESYEALTMSRIAKELDTVDSAVYRYFPSKGALLRELQRESIERLVSSLGIATTAGDEFFRRKKLDEQRTALTRLVLFGRWLCAASESYPEELRLLQMILSRQTSMLDPGGGEKIFPVAMELVGHAVVALEQAQAAKALRPGNALDRAVIWAAGVSGVLQTDDLEQFAPDLFGGTRLARQTSLTLLAGWGAAPKELDRAERLIDQLADAIDLAP